MKGKLMTLEEAAALIPSGATIALGGAGFRRSPLAFVFQLIRNRVRDLRVLSMTSRVAMDVLIAGGCTSHVESAYVGLGIYGLASNFRRGVEQGKVRMEDWSESTMINRFRAAAYGLTFMPSREFVGTSHAEHLDRGSIQEITCPFTGRKLYALRAATSDFTIMHGYYGDQYGNVQRPVRRNTDDADREIAQAATRLIVTVEKIVPHEEVVNNSTLTYIPGRWVTAIVEAPFGAHPGFVDGYYSEDRAVVEQYAASARDPERMQAWLDEYVYGVRDHFEYLDKMGGLRKLASRLRL